MISKNKDISSIFPIIIKIIKDIFELVKSLEKSIASKPYKFEAFVFVNVSRDNLKELSKLILLKLNKEVRRNNETIKIKIVKKYLLISLKSKLILENTNLFIKTFLGLLKDKIWFIEYLVKEYIFKNLKPELVEKKDPPTITSKIYIKFKLVWSTWSEIPIFEILLTKDKKLYVKLVS